MTDTSIFTRESRSLKISSCNLPHLCHPLHCQRTWLRCSRLNCTSSVGVRWEAKLKGHTHTPAPTLTPSFRTLLFYSTEVVPTVALERGAFLTRAAREAPRYPQFTLLSPSQVTGGDSSEFRQEQEGSVCPKFASWGTGVVVKEYHLLSRKHIASVPLSLHKSQPLDYRL